MIVQSMTCTDTRNVSKTVAQIRKLEKPVAKLSGLQIPDREAAEALPAIKEKIHIPLIADIHFDFRLALAAVRNGADGIRINPGNIKKKT